MWKLCFPSSQQRKISVFLRFCVKTVFSKFPRADNFSFFEIVCENWSKIYKISLKTQSFSNFYRKTWLFSKRMLLFRFSSLPFPFYQQFNPLFNGISTPLSIGRSILARGSLGPGPGPGPQRAKMLRRIDKGVDIPLNNGLNRW